MNENVKPSQLLKMINLPPATLQRLNFCGSSKASGVREWVDSLLATKVMHTSSKLYHAIPEVSRLKTDYQNRFDILEILRPSIQYSILGLQKSFLNQPLILPENAQKSVLVAQSLQKNMIDGYLATVIQIAQKGKANKQTLGLLTKTIHRAITGIGLLFFRNYQIYASPPANMWSILNILYQVANYYNLTKVPVTDITLKTARALSIENAYSRVLMLSCSKTNQLSQPEIDQAYTVYESWCQAVSINNGLSDERENFFAVDLLSSQGPIFKSKVQEHNSGHFIELNYTILLSQLSKQSAASEETLGAGATITIPKDFSLPLLNHLIQTWSNVAQRKYKRKNIESPADVAIGLTDSHYFICNGQDFDYFLRSSGSHEPQKISRFSQGLTPASHLDSYQNSSVPVYRVLLQNSSTGGYCILWQGEISAKVVAGELIGIKEIGKRTWSIGVIRWVRQLKQASQLGIQLLANNAKPYGVAQNYDMGGHSEYMRAFFIPPSKFGQGNPTLLTAFAPLQEFDKIKLIDGEREWTAKLERVVFSTKNVQQFRFRNLDSGNAQNSGKNETDTPQKPKSFDSSWE